MKHKDIEVKKRWAVSAVLHGCKPQTFGPYFTRGEAENSAKFYQRAIPQGVFNVLFLDGQVSHDRH